jgi:hypothetical protein
MGSKKIHLGSDNFALEGMEVIKTDALNMDNGEGALPTVYFASGGTSLWANDGACECQRDDGKLSAERAGQLAT